MHRVVLFNLRGYIRKCSACEEYLKFCMCNALSHRNINEIKIGGHITILDFEILGSKIMNVLIFFAKRPVLI